MIEQGRDMQIATDLLPVHHDPFVPERDPGTQQQCTQ
jgi:hypothetical protein